MHLNFSTNFATKRKELNVTQEQIANFVGITKAAVSKWEKGQSYPDITLLPKLATFLNVSIDELLGYEAQLTKEQQIQIYSDLATKFSTLPYEEVVVEVENLIERYYSCFPFLLVMIQLYMNYANLAPNKEELYNRISELCDRVITQSMDHKLITEANIFLAGIFLIQQKSDNVIEILGPDVEVDYGTDLLRAKAWLMKNELNRANEILQVKLYQSILAAISASTESLQFQLNQPTKFDETVNRIRTLLTTYNIESLNINTALIFYYKAATYLCIQNRLDEAVLYIEDYCRLCENIKFPIELKGDEYFDLLTNWISKTIPVGNQAPRDTQSIKIDLINSILINPTFHVLNGRKDYQNCIDRLKKLF